MLTTLCVSLATIGYCMFAKGFTRMWTSAPMVFMGLGVLVALSPGESLAQDEAILEQVAELALVILLFLDAAGIRASDLRGQNTWPTRMLFVALPLVVVFGTLTGSVLFPALPWAALALIAAVLAPTDAALGQVVVTDKRVPLKSRNGLIVESGLNDGLALPIILMFTSLTILESGGTGQNWLLFAVTQIGVGGLVGLIIGWLGARAFLFASERDLTGTSYEGIAVLALAITVFVAAEMCDGNGFIAAFISGLAFGNTVRDKCKFIYEFAETEGQILSWAAFFLIGVLFVPQAIADLTWPILALILISLFVLRPLAVWLSLIKTDATPPTRLFFGWFGPRGLATALFALQVHNELHGEIGALVLTIAINAVWISVLLHGISASPLAALYARSQS